MSSPKTADESKAERILKMGKPLGEYYDALWHQVVWLNVKWTEYVQLFGTNASRTKLLNEAAPQLFYIIQDVMFDNILLDVARITDQPEMKNKRRNLTIRGLPDLIDNLECKKKVLNLIDVVSGASKFSRDWRNRRIAHRDLQLALGKGGCSLAPASRNMVETAISSICDVLDAVSLTYQNQTTFFKFSDGLGAMSLLYVLDDGVRAKKERHERWDKGIHDPRDNMSRDL